MKNAYEKIRADYQELLINKNNLEQEYEKDRDELINVRGIDDEYKRLRDENNDLSKENTELLKNNKNNEEKIIEISKKLNNLVYLIF